MQEHVSLVQFSRNPSYKVFPYCLSLISTIQARCERDLPYGEWWAFRVIDPHLDVRSIAAERHLGEIYRYQSSPVSPPSRSQVHVNDNLKRFLLPPHGELYEISDWSLSTFYTGVHVDGGANVPEDGPLIICANHHNELMDIATLTATVPHRRQISFWAKANSFKNPILRFILVSSGAIPVHRNPNNMRDASMGALRSSGNDSLFRATSRALAGLRPRGGLLNRLVGMFPDRVVGVFPEGTSYTEPCIIQVKEGAAWVALEYSRWMRESADSDGQPIKIIPVGIAYTDKTQYLSRVYVHYGEPLVLADLEDEYHSAVESDDNQRARAVAAELTTRVEKELSRLSVNAPNWDVLRSAEITRRILWTDRDVPLKDLATITKVLISLFSPTVSAIDSELHKRTVASLLAYSGLLHYTNLRHESVSAVIPRSRVHAIGTLFSHLFKTILHPQFILFLPVLVVHIPAYIFAKLAARFLATPELPETIALSKVVGGGLGTGVGYACATAALVRTLFRLDSAWTGSFRGRIHGSIGTAVLAYVMSKILARWHRALIRVNSERASRLLAAMKVALGLMGSSISGDGLRPYLRPPAPPPNPFVRYPSPPAEDSTRVPPARPVPSRKLIRPLFSARQEAERALVEYVRAADLPQEPLWLEIRRRTEFLASRGFA